MRFIFNILFLVGALAGGFYYFFHNTPLWKNFFPDYSVNLNQPLENITLQIVDQKQKDIGRTLNRVDIRDAYLQALDMKYHAILNKVGVAKLESFLAAEKSNLPAYLHTHDTNNNNRLELIELRRAKWEENDFAFPIIDRNNDNGLSVDEYWAHLKVTKAEWFKQKDGNGDGILSKTEYDAAFPRRAAKAKAFAEQLDSNGNNFLDESEWANAKVIFRLH